jgi:hypothetical protein
MGRRWGLATVVLGALAAAALAQSQPVVTLPLKPPPQKETKQEAAPKPAAPKPAEQTVAVATKPAVPLAPQALFTIPPPAFTTDPLFPPGLALDPDSLPPPEIEPALLQPKEAPAAEPPMPRPKPALFEEASPAVTDEAPPLPRGPMQPIDDYRPDARPSVVIDQKALDRTLLPAKQKPAAQPPLPRAKPAVAVPQVETAPAAIEEVRPLRRGEMEPIDDYRPAKLAPGGEKPAKTPTPQPKPAAPKKPPPNGEMKPVDDIPGGKLYVAAAGKAPAFRCFVRDVMAFYDRTHIRCYNKARGKLNFFAVDTNQPVAATLLEKGFAAMQSGKPVTITFAPDSDLNPSNCDRANCRRLIDIKD